MSRMVWFLIGCAAAAGAVVFWNSGFSDQIDLVRPSNHDDSDLLDWCRTNDTTPPDDLSNLDGS